MLFETDSKQLNAYVMPDSRSNTPNEHAIDLANTALPLSLGGMVTLAGIWEATAPKPGNVYRGADFEDMTYADFLVASTAIGQAIDRSLAKSREQLSVGKLVLAATEAMQQSVNVNTHLGTLLLLGPLVLAAHDGTPCRVRTAALAKATTVEDAELAYQAIRLAKPGGMGHTDEADIGQQPELSLYAAMQLAADRDSVARQYTDGFAQVFTTSDHIAARVTAGDCLCDAIVHAFLTLLSEQGDTLIARKCGLSTSDEAADRASSVLRQADWLEASADFDFWLRSDGHRRNPGTTADIVGAALFVLMAENKIAWPARYYAHPIPFQRK